MKNLDDLHFTILGYLGGAKDIRHLPGQTTQMTFSDFQMPVFLMEDPGKAN